MSVRVCYKKCVSLKEVLTLNYTNENKRLDSEALKKEAVERLKKDGSMLGMDGVFTPWFKEFLEEAMEGELNAHL